MQTFHIEMLEGNEFVEILNFHWVVPSILFFYKEEVAQKLPFREYYVFNSFFLQHFQNFLFH